MRNLILIFFFLTSFSCNQTENKIEVPVSNPIIKDTFNFERYFDKAYDITDLTKYKDTSKFIARFRYYPAFDHITIIELTELSNGINLCAKQPLVRVSPDNTPDLLKSLPFNQLCYWYADDEAKHIKNLFNQYSNKKSSEDLKCPLCFDPSLWKIEIFNHGTYSSIKKDYKNETDSIFISTILSKVKLSDKKLSIR